jgi:hypothetical protein
MKSPEQKIETASTHLPEYIKMYEVPGQDQITAHSFERYTANKGREDVLITTQNEKDSLMKLAVERFREEFFHADKNKQSSLIRAALENPNPMLQKAAAKVICKVPDDERPPLILAGVGKSDIEVQWAAGQMIMFSGESEHSLREAVLNKIRNGLEGTDLAVQKEVLMMIEYAPEKERASLIYTALENPNPEVQKMALDQVWTV